MTRQSKTLRELLESGTDPDWFANTDEDQLKNYSAILQTFRSRLDAAEAAMLAALAASTEADSD